MKGKIWYVMITILAASGCSPTEVITPELPTLTPSPLPSATATIVWFPPTSTFTPLPLVKNKLLETPTETLEFGEVILRDEFTQHDLWETGKSSIGNIAFGRGELSFGVIQPGGFLYSLRAETVLDDFYLEIQVKPSICREKDEYGILFRITPAFDYYLFGVNCAGEARVVRVLKGNASILKAPERFGAIPAGAPSTLRLSIQAIGKEIHLYSNSELLFAIGDPSLVSGGIGLFARSADSDLMSVNYSDLTIYKPHP